MLGVSIVEGGAYYNVLERLGLTDWRERGEEVEARYGGFQPVDLYPDALGALAAVRAAGYRVAILANQPAQRTAELRALGVEVDVMAMSAELGASKPSREFYARSLELLGNPDPGSVVYVGDRVDNDVVASAAAGMRPIWIRRGPWGHIQSDSGEIALATIRSLDELVECLPGVFAADLR